MNLNPLRVFLAVVDGGSQHAAARALGLTQPAVAKSLKTLEAELGVRLFERSVHGARLTRFGDSLLIHARLIEAELATCVDTLNQLRGTGGGRISIALSHLPSSVLLPRVMKPFRDRWPDVRLQIVAGTVPHLFTSLRDGRIDFAIAPVSDEDWPEDMQRLHLIDSSLAPIARRGHPLTAARSLAEIADAEWIVPTEGSTTARALGRMMADLGLAQPSIRTTCETLTGMIVLIESSDLVGFVPREMLPVVRRMAPLEPLAIADIPGGAPLCLISRRASAPAPACRDLIDSFVQVARNLPMRGA